jgi:hypothetical protein
MGRAAKREENINSTTARIVPAMYMKMNGENSPNPGKLLFSQWPNAKHLLSRTARPSHEDAGPQAIF